MSCDSSLAGDEAMHSFPHSISNGQQVVAKVLTDEEFNVVPYIEVKRHATAFTNVQLNDKWLFNRYENASHLY